MKEWFLKAGSIAEGTPLIMLISHYFLEVLSKTLFSLYFNVQGRNYKKAQLET